MEKFAVDIDKVLDEFEESEGKTSHLSIYSSTSWQSNLKNTVFDPIDLADADFGIIKNSYIPPVESAPSLSLDIQDTTLKNVETRKANLQSFTPSVANGYHEEEEVLCVSVSTDSDTAGHQGREQLQIQLLPSSSCDINFENKYPDLAVETLDLSKELSNEKELEQTESSLVFKKNSFVDKSNSSENTIEPVQNEEHFDECVHADIENSKIEPLVKNVNHEFDSKCDVNNCTINESSTGVNCNHENLEQPKPDQTIHYGELHYTQYYVLAPTSADCQLQETVPSAPIDNTSELHCETVTEQEVIANQSNQIENNKPEVPVGFDGEIEVSEQELEQILNEVEDVSENSPPDEVSSETPISDSETHVYSSTESTSGYLEPSREISQLSNLVDEEEVPSNPDTIMQHNTEEVNRNEFTSGVTTASETHEQSLRPPKINGNQCDNVPVNESVHAGNVDSGATERCENAIDCNAANTDIDEDRPCRPTTLPLASKALPASEDDVPEGAEVDSLPTMSDCPEDASQFLPVLSDEEQQLGKVKPFWIPDVDAANCMICETKFTMIKRRHHCRACGKVCCYNCCNQKAKLPCLDNKEGRVCQRCMLVLNKVQAVERLSGGMTPSGSWSPNPNNPHEYCSTVSPLQQGISARPPPTVMVPVGVLKRGDKPRGEPKQVMFSDGIRPGGDLSELGDSSGLRSTFKSGRVQKMYTAGGSSWPSGSSGSIQYRKMIVSDKEGVLPPILLPQDMKLEEKLDATKLFHMLEDKSGQPIVFALTKNLHLLTKIVNLDCCINNICWCFASKGLCNVGQDEIMFLLEKKETDSAIPRDAFRLFNTLYDNASKGQTVSALGHILFPEGVLGSREHSGFLFIQSTLQCLKQLVVPTSPWLVALLIQRWEVPWAKLFPLRLVLRLGTEFRYYPCPLVSVRFRKPVYCEVGHTIMNVLADFRNYQYTIPVISGLVIHMESKTTTVRIPRNRYEQLMKASDSKEHVLALGATFSPAADSHLVCVQNDDGNYQTQAIRIQNTARKVTGASFIVFSGALKASYGLSAKSSIVEDGLLVQIASSKMFALRNSLKDMKDFVIECGPADAEEPEEVVEIKWVEDDKAFNIGVKSPVDGQSLEGIPSVRIHTGTDYSSDRYLIRWTELFLLQIDDDKKNRGTDSPDPQRIAETLSKACSLALLPHLHLLAESELTKIGLRVTLDSERVGYEVGSLEECLPSVYMNELDSALIPVITSGPLQDGGPLVLELIFHILLK